MRDIIWTIIVIWLIYKVVDLFRSAGQKKTYAYQQNQQNRQQSTYQNNSTNNAPPKKDLKSALRKSVDKDGEYVDFEELK